MHDKLPPNARYKNLISRRAHTGVVVELQVLGYDQVCIKWEASAAARSGRRELYTADVLLILVL